MHTLDNKGWLPLHHALHKNVSIGAIKLMVKVDPSALRVADYQISCPLHIACEFIAVDVVNFLVELNESCLNNCDLSNKFPLHYAYRGGNCGDMKYFLGRCVTSVPERNGKNKLPIQLLCEHGEDEEVASGSPENIETI